MNRSCAVAALALAAATAFSAPASADWYYRPGWSPGAAAAVGVLGGVAVGAAIAANARPVPAPVYVAPPPDRGGVLRRAPARLRPGLRLGDAPPHRLRIAPRAA